MKRIALLICLLATTLSALAQTRVTIDQLAQRLADGQARGDKYLAHRLQSLQLTQRLSVSRLQKLEAAMPGPESRSALLAVADVAEFLDLPPGEIPSDPPPSAAQQQQIVSRLLDASNHPAALPDFDVTADLTRFRNVKFLGADPADPDCRLCFQALEMQHINPMAIVLPVPIALNRGTDRIAVRDRRLIVTHPSRTWVPEGAVMAGAESWEGLYTVLSNLLHDMPSAQPQWVRWEHGPAGNLAVFRFSVAEDRAHFPVRVFTQLPVFYQKKVGYSSSPSYNAEIAVDPATGAVHRFVIRADFRPGQHVTRADVAGEFAPVTVEGNSFLAPLRAITFGVAQTFLIGGSKTSLEDIRPVIHLADVEFTGYRAGQSNAPITGDPHFVAAAMQMKRDRVTVDQLDDILTGLRGRTDPDIAQRLGQLELTQRLTARKYDRMRQMLPGKSSADALLALYDLSAFADPPIADVPPGSVPDEKQQGKILESAIQFVASTTHRMPDLFATRQLQRFEDLEVVRGALQPPTLAIRPLIPVDHSAGTVHFREGRELVETGSNSTAASPAEMGLNTWGAFGPILETVMADVLNSKIGWSRWEHTPSGPLAIFRYIVPQPASHYTVRFCCYLTDDGSASSFAATPGYHGEIAIDPKTGAILRLVLMADLKGAPAQQDQPSRTPILRSDVLIDYSAFDIAGKQYVCPARSVSVMTTWTLGAQGPVKQDISKDDGARTAKKALALMEFSRVNAINEAAFRDYHVFRSDMRIVSEPAEASPDPKK